MYNKLIEKLKQEKRIIAQTRRLYPEIARQASRNVKAIEKQIKIAQKS